MLGLSRFALVVLGGSMLMSCHQTDTVRADFDYQPRPAADAIQQLGKGKYGKHEIDGQLRGVDMQAQTLVMRVQNGMDQTFRWDGKTVITGFTSQKAIDVKSVMAELARKQGAELVVDWHDENLQRVATTIDVRDLPLKNTPASRLKKKVR
jgi:hypothetical protein